MLLGQKIKKLRETKGYSQEYMADQLEISQGSYSDLENNKTKFSIDRLKKIDKVLGIDFFELLTSSEPITFNENQNGGVANNALIINQSLSEKIIEQ